MDGCKGIEPSSSDWKSEIITIIPTPDVEDTYCPPGSAHRVYSAIGVEEPYSYTLLNKCCIVFAIPHRSEMVISEPWPSARIMELPVRIERTSKHYKCLVLTFVLWEHTLYGRGPRFRPSVFRVKAERTTIVLVPLISVGLLKCCPALN